MEILASIVSITTSVIFWCVFLITLIGICQKAGINVHILEKISAPNKQSDIHTPVKYDDCKVILFGICTRLLTLCAAYFMLWYANEAPVSMTALFEAFIRSDSRHYLNIAQTGYTWEEDGKNLLLVFFPLYSYLVKFISVIVQDITAAAFTVSFASYCAGLCFLHRLVKSEFGAGAARRTVLLISLAPPSFFFGVPMSESLMLLTSAAALYFIRSHRWAPAAIAGALCAFTRMVGIILFAAAIAEFFMQYQIFALARAGKWSDIRYLIGRKGIWIMLMPLGSLAYLFINWQVSGNPLQFIYYQRTHWNQSAQYFGITIREQFGNIAAYSNPNVVTNTFIPNIIAFIIAITLLAYAVYKKLPETYIIYTLGYIFVSFGLTWLLSGARYTLNCVPLFIFLAVYTGKKPVAGGVIFAISGAGLLWMMNRFILGGHVY